MPSTEQSLLHVLKVPMVRDFLTRLESSKLAPLLEHYRQDFLTAPAAATMHHNFTHGLLIHTAEVWEAAERFYDAKPDSVPYMLEREEGGHDPKTSICFTRFELFVAVALHDFAKIWQYEATDNYSWRKIDMICNQETYTLRECARFGIELTDNELVGLLHAEGGYTEFDVEWRPMSVIVHAADLWSSQAMRAMWNPAEALSLTCPTCDSPMRAINGSNGLFYGCTRYSAGCRGTRNADAVPSIEGVFVEWLKKNYPAA